MVKTMKFSLKIISLILILFFISVCAVSAQDAAPADDAVGEIETNIDELETTIDDIQANER